MADFDLAVIGAGASGTAVARDAAGRGIKVLLLEQNDLATGASFAPGMPVCGALGTRRRGAFGAFRTALMERETMLATAPHLVQAQRLVLLPQDSGRSPLALRARLFGCDYFTRRRILPPTEVLDLTHHACGTALRRQFDYGFACWDCRADEIRLPIANARDAAERGAVVRLRTRFVRAERSKTWALVLSAGGEREVVTAHALVNAAGASVQQVAARALPMAPPPPIRCIKETYIVTGRQFDHDGGYLLPDRRDGRFILVLPIGEDASLIGPVEQDLLDAAAPASPTAEEIASLCALYNHFFRQVIHPKDVLPFARVRVTPAGRRRSATPRGFGGVLHFDQPSGLAPLVTIRGGMVMMARRLAQSVVDRLSWCLRGAPAWTGHSSLPGGDLTPDRCETLVAESKQRWPFLDAYQVRRLASSYGTRIDRVLGNAAQAADLGERFGRDLTAAEVGYLMREEWAQTADDVLWRRSSLGIGFAKEDHEALMRFMAVQRNAPSAGRDVGVVGKAYRAREHDPEKSADCSDKVMRQNTE